MATSSESSIQEQTQDGGRNSLLEELRGALADTVRRKLELGKSKGYGTQKRISFKGLCKDEQRLKKWIDDMKDNNTCPPRNWKEQIGNERIGNEPKQKPVLKIPSLELKDFPEDDKLYIKHARVLVLAIKHFYSTSVPNRYHDDTYRSVKEHFIDSFGYEDTLEYMMRNIILLYKLGFNGIAQEDVKDVEITQEKIQDIIHELDFKESDFNINHLDHFKADYKTLLDKIVDKQFWPGLRKASECRDENGDDDHTTVPESLLDTYWTIDEMKLMLKILIHDRRDHSNTNALIVFVSSHGNENENKESVIFDCRGQKLEVNKILQLFSNNSTQDNNMCNLLVFNACRGKKKHEDHLVEIKELPKPAEYNDQIQRQIVRDESGTLDRVIEPRAEGASSCTELEEKQTSIGDTGVSIATDQIHSTSRSVEPDFVRKYAQIRDEDRSIDRVIEPRSESDSSYTQGADKMDDVKSDDNIHTAAAMDKQISHLSTQETLGNAPDGALGGITDDAAKLDIVDTQCEDGNDNMLADIQAPIEDTVVFTATDQIPSTSSTVVPESNYPYFPQPNLLVSVPVRKQGDNYSVYGNFEGAGYCPNNCLVAYVTTPGFTSWSYNDGSPFIELWAHSIIKHKQFALLPFLTILQGYMANKYSSMPMFDHRLTKMPVFIRKDNAS